MGRAVPGAAATRIAPRSAVTEAVGVDLDRWPGRERRSPSRADRHYLVLAPLAAQMRSRLAERFAGRRDLRVLDIGCGQKPYLPLVASYAREYRGLDAEPGPQVDDVGAAEELPYEDGSFDLVLCTQVLEHVQEPGAVVREIHRVLAPGGVALASTHGVFLYHPDPPDSDQDYWRWTHAGLAKLFRSAGQWGGIEVSPNGDVVACLAYLVCQFVDEAGARLGRDRARRAALALVNRAGESLDRRYPPRARVPRPGSLSANYLVTAVRT